YSIVLGYLVGFLFQFAVLGGQVALSFPARYSLTLAGSGEAFRALRGAGTAQVGGALAWQGVVLVERIIASFLPPGTLTALNWGFKIMSTLAELLAGSVGTVALPALSKAFARQAREEEHRTFRDTLEISLALVSPFMVFCLMLDRNIIRLVFERGNFTPEATHLMAMIFFYYALSLLLFSFVRVLTFYLFARNEVGVFFRFALVLYGLNVAFDLFYVGLLRQGAVGIPLGLLTALVLTVLMTFHRNIAEIKQSLDRTFAAFSLKNLVGAALAVGIIWALRLWLKTPTTGSQNFLYLSVLCGAGLLVFAATLLALGAFPMARTAAHRLRMED
ncbi:MAG: lipid II flippase MurJ, partial [Burkholderiales bacterium]